MKNFIHLWNGNKQFFEVGLSMLTDVTFFDIIRSENYFIKFQAGQKTLCKHDYINGMKTLSCFWR